jgi:hypothetical protein
MDEDTKSTSTEPVSLFTLANLVANLKGMSLSEIACVIKWDWKKVNYAARPYLEALMSMESIDEDYGADSGSSVVAYFLCNATTWRGEVAKLIKKELNRRLKAKRG